MHIKGKGFIKLFLFIFIGTAIYMGHKDFFATLPGKLKNAIPYDKDYLSEDKIQNPKSKDDENDAKALKFKFSTKEKDSLVGNVVSNTLNKILENPKGRGVVKGVLQKMMRQSQEITGQDLFLSRYLVQDLVLGKGKKATCGDKVEILYSNVVVKDNSAKKEGLKKEIIIGKGIIGINLENGIIGMKVGGKRNIISPITEKSKNIKHATKQQTMSVKIKLLSVKNKINVNKNLGRPFFDKINEEDSSSLKLICGDKVKGAYVLSDLKGNILYDSQKLGNDISFRIGDPQIPIELSNALIGLPARKAMVSFIDSSTHIKNSFKNIRNFIFKDVFTKNNNPVILNFKLSIYPRSIVNSNK